MHILAVRWRMETLSSLQLVQMELCTLVNQYHMIRSRNTSMKQRQAVVLKAISQHIVSDGGGHNIGSSRHVEKKNGTWMWFDGGVDGQRGSTLSVEFPFLSFFLLTSLPLHLQNYTLIHYLLDKLHYYQHDYSDALQHPH